MSDQPSIAERDVLLRQMKAALVKCCEAGRVAYPDQCPWHGQVHRQDESVPVEHVRLVGPVLRCICGRDYVAGHPCPASSVLPPEVTT